MPPFGFACLAVVTAIAVYFGGYFLAADYVDFGDNIPNYLVQYRLGSLSLDRFAGFFEPARRIDDRCFRHRHGSVMGRPEFWSNRGQGN